MFVTVIESIDEMREWSAARHREEKSVGFVPTMGALHAGHGSLIQRARQENAAVVVSIFVNPLQFAPQEDFDRYPRTFAEDQALCASYGADAIFLPPRDHLVPDTMTTAVINRGAARGLESARRPKFFEGVTTIVAKLFNIVRPARAYFGEKDYQQLTVIRQMTRDLDMGIEIVGCPLVREADGLALSSRNRYLNPAEREAALSLIRGLRAAKEWIESGERDSNRIATRMRDLIERNPLCRVDYIALVDAANLLDRPRVGGTMCIAIAVDVGSTRLIDNLLIEVQD